MSFHSLVLMHIVLMTVDGAAQWFATTLRLLKKVVRARFALFKSMKDSCARRARVP